MTLRQRLIIAVSVMMVTVSLVLFSTGKAGRIRAEKSLASPVNVGKHYAWEMAVQERLAGMQEQAGNLEMAFEIKTALKSGERERLTQQADVFFELMKDTGAFTRLRIVAEDGTILYAAPDPVAGASRQQTVAQAIETGEYAAGLERDDTGTVVLSLAIPIKSRRTIHGIGVYNLDLTSVTEAVAEVDGSDIFVVSADGDLIAGSRPERFAELGIDLPPPGQIDLFTRRTRDAAFSVAVQPITGMNDGILAHLVAVSDVTAAYHRARRSDVLLLVLTAAAVLTALAGLGAYIRRALNPLQTAIDDISAVAAGDLTRRFDSDRRDEIGALLNALNTMTRDLRTLFDEVALTGRSLAEGAASQATALETATAALGQISSMTADNAAHADRGNRGIGAITARMATAEVTLQTVTATMREVSKDSCEIQHIVTTLDEIALKTNILALNAAIEAAHAGEAGAGFAVVADEVRNLAANAARSASDISRRIEQTVGNIARSDTAVEKAATQFHELIEAIREVSQTVAQIASASGEQSNGIDEINTTVNAIQRVVAENVKRSQRLTTTLQRFIFAADDGATAPARKTGAARENLDPPPTAASA